MIKVRPTAVAGRFYHRESDLLRQEIVSWLSPRDRDDRLRAVIVPHAGYRFSGQLAADAFSYIQPLADKFRRVILLGPSHTMSFKGVAIPSVDLFVTPLGNVPVDKALVEALRDNPLVSLDDAPHAKEHCLEVQLPFLQQTLGEFSVLPIVYSRAMPWHLEELLNDIWDPDDTLLVISSDLSHYHNYEEATQLDGESMTMIEEFVPRLTPHQACGATGINTLLHLAQSRGWQLSRVGYMNSGDTGGDKNRVVGYVSYLVSQV
ncbi:AmmeMemoRadiSam system protein B [Shewanella corallii]|uniref:MEMO1 family protein L2725_03885 n=1 Tax=Shewanella corallii TaxID=560080 RepID=A0ABT0N3B6_9GAMM|nr:AmmeMemoRadiSam system protein B [Shewanella corallii]MCL2912924.1 AmmeMemoRadiSam system protein B [Shewanella corallii]